METRTMSTERKGKDNKTFRKVMIHMNSYSTAAHKPDLGVTNNYKPSLLSFLASHSDLSTQGTWYPDLHIFPLHHDLHFRRTSSHGSHSFDALLPSYTSSEFCSPRSMRWVWPFTTITIANMAPSRWDQGKMTWGPRGISYNPKTFLEAAYFF